MLLTAMDMIQTRLPPWEHVAQSPSPHQCKQGQGHRSHAARISLGSDAVSVDLDDTSGGSSFSARVRALNAGDSPSATATATVDSDGNIEVSGYDEFDSDSDVEACWSWNADLDHLEHDQPSAANPEINANSDLDTVHGKYGDNDSDDGSGSVHNSESAAREIPQPSQVHDSHNEPEPESRKRPYHLVDPPLRELGILRMARTHSSIMAANNTAAPVPKLEFRVGPTGTSVPPNASQKQRRLISSGPDAPNALRNAETRCRINAIVGCEDADMGFRLNWNRAPTTNHNGVRPFLILERQANSPVSDSEEESSSH